MMQTVTMDFCCYAVRGGYAANLAMIRQQDGVEATKKGVKETEDDGAETESLEVGLDSKNTQVRFGIFCNGTWR